MIYIYIYIYILCLSCDGSTYNNASLGHSCAIDHVFISNAILQFIKGQDLLNSRTDISDRTALPATFDFILDNNSVLHPRWGRYKSQCLSRCGVEGSDPAVRCRTPSFISSCKLTPAGAVKPPYFPIIDFCVLK